MFSVVEIVYITIEPLPAVGFPVWVLNVNVKFGVNKIFADPDRLKLSGIITSSPDAANVSMPVFVAVFTVAVGPVYSNTPVVFVAYGVAPAMYLTINISGTSTIFAKPDAGSSVIGEEKAVNICADDIVVVVILTPLNVEARLDALRNDEMKEFVAES
jgi:hypothetical protein